MDLIVDNLTIGNEGRLSLDHISLKAFPGKVFGVLGPAGAGKTTLIRTVLGLIKQNSGTVTFDGRPISAKIRNKIGYLPEERGIYQKQSLVDVLSYFGRLKNLSKKKAKIEAIRLLDRFDMIDVMEKTVASLSKEAQEKLQILIIMIHDPEVLILDEPFQNLHPLNQDLMRKLIYRFREEEKLTVISTNQFNEAEKICDEVLFLNKGKILLQGNLDRLREQFKSHLVLVESDDNLGALKEIKGVKKFFAEKQSAKLFVDHQLPPKEILQKIISSVSVSRIEINRPNLDDIFFDVLNNGEAK